MEGQVGDVFDHTRVRRLLVTVESKRIRGPEVKINCPVCKATATGATSHQQVDRLLLVRILPVYTGRVCYVTCGACGSNLLGKLSIDQVGKFGPAEIEPFLVAPPSRRGKIYAFASVALPILGLLAMLMLLLLVIIPSEDADRQSRLLLVSVLVVFFPGLPMVGLVLGILALRNCRFGLFRAVAIVGVVLSGICGLGPIVGLLVAAVSGKLDG